MVAAAPCARELIAELVRLGFEVFAAGRGRYAVPVARTVRPDLVVLDPVLPDPGFDTRAELRAAGVVAPVLPLPGGPFVLAELVERVQRLLRDGLPQEDTAGTLLHNGSLTVDPGSGAVRRDGRRIELAAREFDLLLYLMGNAGQVVTKRQILDRVWRSDPGGDPGVVETYVYYLRRKLDDHDRSLIRTVRGLGYTMPKVR